MPTILLTGSPPEDHERRCQGKSNVRKARCLKWALKGSKYCKFHGGRQKLARIGNMKRVYSQYLGPTLKSRLEEMLDASHDDQVQLYEELAMSRVMAQEAIKLADIALSQADDKNKNGNGINKGLAIDIVQKSLSVVKDFALAAQKLETDAKNTVSLRVVDLFIAQIMKSIQSVLGDDTRTVELIESHIAENVRIPSSRDPNVSIEGTILTPDKIVEAMDDTIMEARDG